jgi:hypothetical protein
MVEIGDDVLVYDAESKTFGMPDPSKDILRFLGCYSYKLKKPLVLAKKSDMLKVISDAKFLVGFNNVGTKQEPGYDNPLLIKEGFDLKYKISIDLRNIIKQRAASMKVKQGILKDLLMKYSLDYITVTLGLVTEEERKLHFDYSILNKDIWTDVEKKLIYEYTVRDIELTKKLYEFVEEYFASFKDFLKEDDVRKKVYLTASIAKFAYKAICKAMVWEETYGEYGAGDEEDSIAGGYVAYPAGEHFEGDLYCLDFNSLYPHIMIMCNLYGRILHPTVNGWKGNGVWKVEGIYDSKEMSGVSKLLHKWYLDRQEYQKVGDRREYTIKIILNTIYGILNTAYYARVYDLIAGGDCTRIGRQWTKYARKKFAEAGYLNIYSDTDSCYLVDPFHDKEKLLKVKDDIINYIKASVPFPVDTFDMKIDDEISHMFFFKGDAGDKSTDTEMDEFDFVNKGLGFMKKNYLYITKSGKVKFKNLGVKKKSTSLLTRKIFNDYIMEKIKTEHKVKFSKAYYLNLIRELLEKDMMLASMRKEVGPYSQYEKTSPTGLSAQIAKKYGAGIHFLIPNLADIGVGKGKSYCTENEFKKNKLSFEHIDLSNVWAELEYFIEAVKTKSIFEYQEDDVQSIIKKEEEKPVKKVNGTLAGFM